MAHDFVEELAGGVRSDGRVALGHRVNDGDSGHEATRTAEQPPNLFRFVGLTGCLPRLALRLTPAT
jgi:hypothetical protein